MKRVYPAEDWPDSWKYSHPYDLQEVYGQASHLGYAYAYENRRRHTLRLVTEVLPAGARILDVAAAQGNFSLTLAELGYRVTWNDLRADLAGYVRLKYERGDLSFAAGNVFELAFPSLFDAVVITEIIEHVAHPDEFLANAARLIKPGGYVIMTTPNGAYFRNRLPRFSECPDPSVYESVQFKPNADGHIFLLYPDEIPPLATRAGLELDQLLLFTNPLTNGHLKSESALRILPKGFIFGVERVTRCLPRAIGQKVLVQMGARFRRPALWQHAGGSPA
jgi:2-polyprenyl-6-hydroxyphenyl methylase/3-demethylubiquinone-9 3-methyltransferase